MRPGKSAGPLSIACRAVRWAAEARGRWLPIADQHRARGPRPRAAEPRVWFATTGPIRRVEKGLTGISSWGRWTGVRGATVPCADPRPRKFDSVSTRLYNGACIPRVYPLIGGGVAEWLKAAVC
jgi:hypothetical protein